MVDASQMFYWINNLYNYSYPLDSKWYIFKLIFHVLILTLISKGLVLMRPTKLMSEENHSQNHVRVLMQECV